MRHVFIWFSAHHSRIPREWGLPCASSCGDWRVPNCRTHTEWTLNKYLSKEHISMRQLACLATITASRGSRESLKPGAGSHRVPGAPRDPGKMGQSFCAVSAVRAPPSWLRHGRFSPDSGLVPSLTAASVPQWISPPCGGTWEYLSIRSQGFFLGLHDAPTR